MNLFILRHAAAIDRGAKQYPRDDRPLTDKGRRKMEKAVICFPSLLGNVDAIISSPLSRAKETAEIAAKRMWNSKQIRCCDELLPGGSVVALVSLLKNEGEKNLLIVGHEPNLSRLAMILINGNGGEIALKKGGLCHISFSGPVEPGEGILRFLLMPKHLRLLSSRSSRSE